MPTAVLELLTGKLSNCRVHIAQTTCRIARLDEQMLKLPNMYRIDLTVLNGSYPPISEFPILDRILPDASRLQHLSLKPIECDGWAGRKEFERLGVESEEMHGPLHLATPLVRCQLRSLTLSGHIFMDYWPQTLLPWMSAMDWTQLRHLNLADAAHRAIIVDLTGRVPRLESLRLGHPDNTDAYTFPADLHYLKAFLTAAQELRSVSLVNWPASDFEHLLDTVLACLGPNLHSFGVIPSRRVLNRFLWNAAQLKKCCAMAPNLRELTVELDPNCQHAPLCMNLTEQTTYDESWVCIHHCVAQDKSCRLTAAQASEPLRFALTGTQPVNLAALNRTTSSLQFRGVPRIQFLQSWTQSGLCRSHHTKDIRVGRPQQTVQSADLCRGHYSNCWSERIAMADQGS